ncbi:sigma-70 family RNA polymerase sigma factor [Trebonia sp.]|uniref:RNA polymerase sigma factor n=1 Tax=Trebonia sp. TaxID=2767075 RepID=UPI0026027EE6|nr:sigma-70 family RNA polymerase sigma factor [Trebonia sp.]
MTSDGSLISRSLAGDGEAFVEVVRRHSATVSAYLLRRAGREAAEDLLGEVWVAAFGARSGYDPGVPDARPWLLGIARNVLRRHWRMRPHGEAALGTDEVAPPVDPWPAVDEWIDGAAIVRQALVRLSPGEREVLLLVVWEQLTVADAARALAIPPGTARRRLHQARVTLRSTPEIVALLNDCNECMVREVE